MKKNKTTNSSPHQIRTPYFFKKKSFFFFIYFFIWEVLASSFTNQPTFLIEIPQQSPKNRDFPPKQQDKDPRFELKNKRKSLISSGKHE